MKKKKKNPKAEPSICKICVHREANDISPIFFLLLLASFTRSQVSKFITPLGKILLVIVLWPQKIYLCVTIYMRLEVCAILTNGVVVSSSSCICGRGERLSLSPLFPKR